MTAAEEAGADRRPSRPGVDPLADTIRTALHRLDPTTPPTYADMAADAVRHAFVLIPRSETEDVETDLFAPDDLIEDPPAWENYLHAMAANASAEAIRDGLLIISRPTVAEVNPPGHFANVTGAQQYKLRALGWRLPDQDPPAPGAPT